MAEHNSITEPIERPEPTRSRGRRGRTCHQRGTRVFHQMTERHSRRACCIATATLHTRIHRSDERFADWRGVLLHRSHRGDATARGGDF